MPVRVEVMILKQVVVCFKYVSFVGFLTFLCVVQPPVRRSHHARVVVDMTSEDVLGQLGYEYKYPFWTFSGKVPGPMIRARVGDVLEIRHKNLDSSGIAHNVDFHGIAGPGGGAAATLVGACESEGVFFEDS